MSADNSNQTGDENYLVELRTFPHRRSPSNHDPSSTATSSSPSNIYTLSMPVSPKYETTIPLLSIDNSSHSLSNRRSSLTACCRRSKRIPLLLSFPLTLAIIYIAITYSQTWLKGPNSLISPHVGAYISHAGKKALETTIVLPNIQYPFLEGEGRDVNRREKVRDAIRRTWELYSKEAWAWDEVKPNQGGGRDTRYHPLSYIFPQIYQLFLLIYSVLFMFISCYFGFA